MNGLFAQNSNGILSLDARSTKQDFQNATNHIEEFDDLRLSLAIDTKELYEQLVTLIESRNNSHKFSDTTPSASSSSSSSRLWNHIGLFSCTGPYVANLIQRILQLDCTRQFKFGTYHPERQPLDIVALAKGLATAHSLRVLDVGLGKMTIEGIFLLADALGHCVHLTELNLGILQIAEGNSNNTRNHHDMTKPESTSEILLSARHLAKAIVHDSHIDKIIMICYGDEIQSPLQSAVLEELQHHPSMLHELRFALFPPWAIYKTIPLLQHNKLQGLDVACVRFMEPGGRHHGDDNNSTDGNHGHHQDDEDVPSVISIAHALETNTSLQFLDLSVNSINDTELMTITDCLRRNKSCPLEELNLSYNKLTDEGLRYFVSAMVNMKHLKRFHWKGNSTGEDGCRCLMEALKTNTMLEEVDIESRLTYQQEILWLTRCNQGGRRLLVKQDVPRSWWPLVLARINGLEFLGSSSCEPGEDHKTVRVQVLYYFLRNGPVLLEQG